MTDKQYCVLRKSVLESLIKKLEEHQPDIRDDNYQEWHETVDTAKRAARRYPLDRGWVVVPTVTCFDDSKGDRTVGRLTHLHYYDSHYKEGIDIPAHEIIKHPVLENDDE